MLTILREWLKAIGFQEDPLEAIKTFISVFGVIAALAGGTVAYMTYRSTAELQALRALHEVQLKTCGDVAEAAAALYSPSSKADFHAALIKFSNLKHGKALAILDKNVLDEMVRLYNKAIHAERKIEEGKLEVTAVQRELCDEPFKVVKACRTMLSRGFLTESRGGIQLLEPEYAMNWANCQARRSGGWLW